jgi:hypothetical protein
MRVRWHTYVRLISLLVARRTAGGLALVASTADLPAAVTGLKLPFLVSFASSAEDGYEAAQLQQGASAPKQGDEKSTPAGAPTHIKGWQSAKYCPYPQTIILRFPGYFDIRKIQILSHQAKIANT